MNEKLDIWKEAAKGFVGGIAKPFGVALGAWLLLQLHQLREPAIAFLHRLAPTSEEVLTICLCLFAVVAFYLAFSFVVSWRRARRRVELIDTKLADVKSGKIDVGSLTIEEMFILRDKLPKQPWKYEKENEAGIKSRIDQLYPRN
jgi:hypothetical protein